MSRTLVYIVFFSSLSAVTITALSHDPPALFIALAWFSFGMAVAIVMWQSTEEGGEDETTD